MDQNVNYVLKPLNPPNVLQARPIENFWGWLTQKVYEEGWEATSEQPLVRRIESKIKEFDLKSVKKLMTGVKAKLKSIADYGVFSYLKKLMVNNKPNLVFFLYCRVIQFSILSSYLCINRYCNILVIKKLK